MTPEKILEKFLSDMERELSGLSELEKQEITAEIRAHLMEKWKETEGTAADMLNTIEEFGAPEEIAREYTGTRPQPSTSSPPAWLTVVLTIIFWPAGIILAWLSPHWRTKHKLVATLIPPVLLVLVLVAVAVLSAGYAVKFTDTVHEFTSYEVTPSDLVFDPRIQPDNFDGQYEYVQRISGPARLVGMLVSVLNILILIAFLCSPLISGVYLAVTKTI